MNSCRAREGGERTGGDCLVCEDYGVILLPEGLIEFGSQLPKTS